MAKYGVVLDYDGCKMDNIIIADSKDGAVEKAKQIYAKDYLYEFDKVINLNDLQAVYIEEIPKTNLQKLRLEAGLSQYQLAQKSGINVRTIQCYEQEKRFIDRAGIKTIAALATALQRKPEEITETIKIEPAKDKKVDESARKIYVCCEGAYEDFAPIAVFDDFDVAKKYLENKEDACILVFYLNQPINKEQIEWWAQNEHTGEWKTI